MPLFTSLIICLSCIIICFSPSLGYRDGAREESCYNHSVVHDNAFSTNCGEGCRYFLTVKQVVNDSTLELGNETDSYECGKIYGIEVNNNLNPPEGYLVQARNGTDVSSEIIGTFLSRSVVAGRDPTLPLNFKILQCRRCFDCSGEYQNNSATHPGTVNDAGTLQLFWQAPHCSTCGLRNINLWFTIVQQLTAVFNPSKGTVLVRDHCLYEAHNVHKYKTMNYNVMQQLQNYNEPQSCTSSIITTTESSDIKAPATSSTVQQKGTGVGGCLVTMLLILLCMWLM